MYRIGIPRFIAGTQTGSFRSHLHKSNFMLIFILQFTNTEIVKMLLKVPEVDVKKGDKFRQTPLELAVGVSYKNYKSIF